MSLASLASSLQQLGQTLQQLAVRQRAEPAQTRSNGVAHANGDCFVPAKGARPDTTWWYGRPLSEGRNAHATNTKGDFEEALKSGANWLEGDIRKELDSDKLEMRHDEGHEDGDNLTLEEWLTRGKASGRGLKLDVKEGEHMREILHEVKAAGIPSERLMWNLGADEMDDWGKTLRKQFPNATMAINPEDDDGAIGDDEVNRMIAQAEKVGQPVAFVVREDRLTDEAIEKLEAHGAVSVWNDPGKPGVDGDDIDDMTRDLRERGVTGVVDLRPSDSLFSKVRQGAANATEAAVQWGEDRLDDVGDFVGGL